MKRISLLIAIPTMALLMACGSGDGGEDSNGNGAVAGETPVGEIQVVRVSVNDDGFEGQEDREEGSKFLLNFEVGKTYEIHFTNNAINLKVLLIFRWGVENIAPPGETTISNTFTPEVPGEYQCHEKLNGRVPAFQCLAVVS